MPDTVQAFVDGTNVRVHTVGQKVFATAISTDATDYRYAHRQGGDHAKLRAVELSDDLAEMCVKLSEGLGLAFAGIDLKVTRRIGSIALRSTPARRLVIRSQHGPTHSPSRRRYLAGE